MSYGELIIYLADGTVQTHELEKDTTAIGRSTGNDVVLPTSSASRYHAHIVVEKGRATFVDLGSVNGTFIGDKLLEPNASVALAGGEQIRIGDVRLVYTPPGGTVFSKDIPQMDETLPAAPLRPELQSVLEEPQQSVAPGSRMQLVLTLENLTDTIRACDIEQTLVDADWIQPSAATVRLEKREKTVVLIQLHPPRGPEVKPGDYELVVTVTPHDAPEQAVRHTRTLEVVAFHGLSMAVHAANQPGKFIVVVQNLGNVAADIQLDGWHSQRALKFDFADADLSLAPGETAQVGLEVQPRQRKRGKDGTPFAVVACSTGVTGYRAAVPAYYAGTDKRGGQATVADTIVS